MKIYLVGGAVRDQLLNLPVKERDWVVTGASVDDMLRLGYQRVGKEFPVFLHPETHEEYALARMERKVKPGYKGFELDTSLGVTLEEDLLRRDLTINAMALDLETKTIIDPYNGQKDLAAKLLRHVSPAFAEDPVRILRVGRFLARYAALGFHVAPETNALMNDMVKSGEVQALVAERVWKELERSLGEKHPDKFFEVLESCGAMPILFPELIEPATQHIDKNSNNWLAFLTAIQTTNDTAVRLAVLMHNSPDSKNKIAALANRYRLPTHYRELAVITAQFYKDALMAKVLPAEDLLNLLSGLDVFRRENRFLQFLLACEAIAKSRDAGFDKDWLFEIATVVKTVDVQELLAQGLQGNEFASALRSKRLAKIADFFVK